MGVRHPSHVPALGQSITAHYSSTSDTLGTVTSHLGDIELYSGGWWREGLRLEACEVSGMVLSQLIKRK